ncbi:hypothetical protein DRQ09_06845 [candidate division KSB1 bacterium]|nr:MAG: hypothetical protein DRQ09_06845 [candidate division KSB1 bacterium]
MIDLDKVLQYLSELSNRWLYFSLFISSYTENIFPPLPGDTITVFGAYLVGIGRLKWSLTYFSTSLGSILGFITPYFIGLAVGRRYFIENNFRFVKQKDILRIEKWFRKYGYWVIAGNRFLASARSFVSLIAGFVGLNFLKVAILGLLSVLLWNGVLIFAGLVIGEKWGIILKYLKLYSEIIIILVVILVIVLLIQKRIFKIKIFRKKK